MFNSKERIKYISVAIVLADGRELNGKLIIAETSTLLRTLNGDGKFAVFVSYDGNHKLIAKSSIVEANEIVVKPVKALSSGNDNGFDPYKILGLSKEANFDAIAKQYKKLSRSYHPAHYTHDEMPVEIAAYALDMSNLIEQAYLSLSAEGRIVA